MDQSQPLQREKHCRFRQKGHVHVRKIDHLRIKVGWPCQVIEHLRQKEGESSIPPKPSS